MSDVIFHHYDTSPFSELVRLAFGLKGLAWKSVLIPNVAPKPDLIPLTGGYRKTPVMQIGANIYCDSAACIEALEAHTPSPSLYPQPLGRAGAIVGAWAAGPMFMPSVSVAMGPIAHNIPPEFWEDRRKLFGLDTERFGSMGPHLKSQFENSLVRADDALADGRAFFGGEDAGYADFTFYMNLWFQKRFGPEPKVLKPFAHLDSWSARVAAIGHGERIELAASEALSIAKAATPVVTSEVDPASGFSEGQPVTVRTEDPGADPVAGALIRLTHRDIAILRDDSIVGQVAVHFPRLGQIVSPA